MTAPTAKQMLDYMASLIGKTGRTSENVNTYTKWFYGNNTSAAWCCIFQSYCFNHFGALDLMYGKEDYVPTQEAKMKSHGQYHTGNPKPGDLVFFDFNGNGTPEHIGMVEKVIDSNTIQTLEGNTGDDTVMRRQRSRSYSTYGTPKYADAGSTPTPTPTPVPETGDVLKTVADLAVLKGQTAVTATRTSLAFDKEYYDPQNLHEDPTATNPAFPSFFPDGAQALYLVTVELNLEAKPAPGLKLAFGCYARTTNDHVSDPVVADVTEADSVYTFLVGMSNANKYRVDLLNDTGADVKVKTAELVIGH